MARAEQNPSFGPPIADHFNCPRCDEDVSDIMFEPAWFEMTGGFPGDSGPGGNTPQEPVAEGWQTCPACEHRWEISG